MRWMKGIGNGDGVLRGRALLRKIRLGVMEKEYRELKVRDVWAAVSRQELERATACAAEHSTISVSLRIISQKRL